MKEIKMTILGESFLIFLKVIQGVQPRVLDGAQTKKLMNPKDK